MKRKHFLIRVLSLVALCFFLVCQATVARAEDKNVLQLQLENYQTVLETLGSEKNDQNLTVWKLPETYSYDNREQIVKDLHQWDKSKLDATFSSATYPIKVTEENLEVAGIPKGLYYVRRIFDTPNLVYQSEFLFQFTDQTKQPLVILAKRIETIKTQVKLVKKDQAGQILEGVGFRLVRLTEEGKEEPVQLVGTYRYQDGKPQTDQILYTDKAGEINVTNLPLGNYRFIETKPLEGYKLLEKPQDFTLTDDRLVTLEVINEKIPKGGFEFIKLDETTKKPLSGATFKITQLVGDNQVTVVKDQKELVLTSGQDGQFKVTDLPYGNYYLWEIKAPVGYVQLTEPLVFEVGETQSAQTVLVVNNRKRPKIYIPNTGDITVYVLLGVATVLLAAGYYLVKTDNSP